MIKLIYDGLSIEGDKVIYNPNIDNDNDIMNTLQPDIYRSKFIGRTYYFGYTFLPSSSRKDRTTRTCRRPCSDNYRIQLQNVSNSSIVKTDAANKK